MTTGTDVAAALLARAARRVLPRVGEICGGIDERVVLALGPALADEQLRQSLAVSTEANVVAALHVLELGLDPAAMEPPPPASLLARRLAQHGAPLTALLRAYRIGHAYFVEAIIGEMSADPEADPLAVAAASALLVRVSAGYVDQVSESLVTEYEMERAAWTRNDSTVRAARIRSVLNDDAVGVKAAERALGYPIAQTHLAVQLWFDDGRPLRGDELIRLERLAAAVAGEVGSQYLFTARDEAGAAVWFSRPGEGPPLPKLTTALCTGDGPSPRVALGRPGAGLAGFRDTHRQSDLARQVAVAAGAGAQTVTDYADVGGIALLCQDLAAARTWIVDTLGPLAEDEENAERLRETARVFLATGCSFTASAELLNMHKNSVQYRVQKAEQVRGRPLKSDRFDVEFALRACHLLGAAVLKRD